MQERHTYDYDVDPEEKNHVAPKIMQMVGQGLRVLEIGAGPGSITRFLKEQAKCIITAIEIDDSALPLLKPFCKEVFQCDLNDPNWMDCLAKDAGFDVIVAADVLEHLLDPWRTLTSMKGLLAPNGYVIVSLPNAGHNGVVAALLSGNFHYHDWGLLDRTHLRFFGMQNIQELFTEAGYAIVDYDYVLHPPETTELGCYWERLPKRLRKALVNSAHGDIYQVVVKARPRQATIAEGLSLVLPGQEPNPIVEKIKERLKLYLPATVRSGLRRIFPAIK